MIQRSVRRKPVTAADLNAARDKIPGKTRKRKAKSLTQAARERTVARVKRRGLMTRATASAIAGEALPHGPTDFAPPYFAPSKLQQLDAQMRAGLARDPLPTKAIVAPSFRGVGRSPNRRRRDEPAVLQQAPRPSLDCGSRAERAAGMTAYDKRVDKFTAGPTAGRSRLPAGDANLGLSLTARVRALYEDGVVPVREIARLVGVTERTLYKYVARGRWRKRYRRRALEKGTAGRFIAHDAAAGAAAADAAGAQPAGLKALDPLAAVRADAACRDAGGIAARAAAKVLRQHAARERRETVLAEFEARVRRLALLTRTLKLLAPRVA